MERHFLSPEEVGNCFATDFVSDYIFDDCKVWPDFPTTRFRISREFFAFRKNSANFIMENIKKKIHVKITYSISQGRQIHILGKDFNIGGVDGNFLREF